MAKNYACVLDFGSGKVTAMIAEKGINNTFNIKGTGESEYAGYYQGEFIEPENLLTTIESVITKAQANSGLEIQKLFVGVPAEFSYVQTKSAGISFKKRTTIGAEEIFALFDQASEELGETTSDVINRSPIYFMLDDNRKCMNPKGEITSKLFAEISFIFAENKFIETITQILQQLGITDLEFISSSLAEAIYLLDPEIRDTGAILIDCGYISTSVALVKGDGLVGLNSFSLGGGHLTADLSQILEIGFKDAENLKRKVVLSVSATDDDYYEIVSKDGVVSPVSAKLTNQIVSARLEMIAGMVSKSLTALKTNTNGAYLPIFLTGGGISYLKGGKDFLSKAIGSNIEIVSPQVPQLSRAHFSSVLGILDLALAKSQTKKLTFKEKFLKLFKK